MTDGEGRRDRRWWLWITAMVLLLGVGAVWGLSGLGLDVPGPLDPPDRVEEDEGARLVVPQGAAPPDAELEVQPQPPLEDEPAAVEDLRASALPGPVSFEVTGELSGPVEIAIPVREGIEEATLVYRAEALGGIWVPVPTRVENDLAIAEVDHLSRWDAVKGTIADRGSWVAYNTHKLLGNRADEPICDGDLPRWVYDVNVIQERNAPLLGCGQVASDGESLDITVAANRGHAIALDVPEGTTVTRSITFDLPQFLAWLFARHWAADKVYIPAASDVDFALRRPAEAPASIDLDGHLDGASVVLDALYVLLEKLPGGKPLLLELTDCVTTTIDASRADPSSASDLAEVIVSGLRSCANDEALEAAFGPHAAEQLDEYLFAVDLIDAGSSATEATVDTVLGTRFVQVLIDLKDYVSPEVLTAAPAADRPTEPSVMLVVDTSGSMSEDDGTGRVKIEGARSALLDFLAGVEPGSRLGLRTYPDTGSSCGVGHRVFSVQERDSAVMAAEIRTLVPDGDTPTAEALSAAADDLRTAGLSGGVIVLVSDGESTCGDPCDAARQIESSGIDIDVISVGFKVSQAGADELECIAEETGGSYLGVNDTETLGAVFDQLSTPELQLTVSHPTTVVADVGVGPDGMVTIDTDVTNASELTARNVVTGIRFDVGDSPGLARPTRALGNLDGRAARNVSWSFKPGVLLAGETLNFEVYTTADNVPQPPTETGQITVEEGSEPEDAGPLLQQADRIAILGDSFSSGEGAQEYFPRSDTADNGCHRSPLTYLAEAFAIPENLIIACSGALTDAIASNNAENNLKNGLESQVAQLADVQRAEGPVDAVLLTLGGNDVGFASVAANCLLSPVPCDERIWLSDSDQYLVSRIRSLGVRLRSSYGAIDAVLNRNAMVDDRGGRAPIVVLSYPRVLPGADRACPSLLTISQPEIEFLDAFVTRLNGEIEAAVNVAAKLGEPVFHVPMSEDAFLPDHTVCDSDQAYANGVETFEGTDEGAAFIADLTTLDYEAAFQNYTMMNLEKQELLHPNAAGYEALTRAVIRWSLTPDGQRAAELPDEPPPPRINPGDTPAEILGGSARSNTVLQPADDPTDVRPGTTYPLEVTEFAPGSPIEVTVESEPIVLSMTTADAEGTMQTNVTMPGRLGPGPHELNVHGFGPDGDVRVVSIPIRVHRQRSLLPHALTTVALLPLVVGGGLYEVTRRRLDREGSDGEGSAEPPSMDPT